MIIHIKKRENPFVQIDKTCLNDERLSWKARGILCYLLSKPPDWQVRIKDLMNRSQNDGRTAVYSAIDELLEAGYMERLQPKDEKGRFVSVEYNVYETPRPGFRDTGNLHTENLPLTNNEYTDNESTNITSSPEKQKQIGGEQKGEDDGDVGNYSVPDVGNGPGIHSGGVQDCEGNDQMGGFADTVGRTVGGLSDSVGAINGGSFGAETKSAEHGGGKLQQDLESLERSDPQSSAKPITKGNAHLHKAADVSDTSLSTEGGDNTAGDGAAEKRMAKIERTTVSLAQSAPFREESTQQNSRPSPKKNFTGETGQKKKPPWVKKVPAQTTAALYVRDHSDWNGLFASEDERREFEAQESANGLPRVIELVDDWIAKSEIPANEIIDALIKCLKKHGKQKPYQKEGGKQNEPRQYSRRKSTIAPHAATRQVATPEEARAILG